MLTLSQLYDGTIGQIATDIRYINVGRMYAHTVLVVFHCHSQFLSENRPCSPLLLHVCVFHGRSPDRHGAGGRDTDVTPVGDKVGCYVALLHLFVCLES